ncbi:DUF5130 family protein [Microlunatus sp. Y2014]|uniref:DUF5130 family protein n=1 Tax=Microlunatus sp. Y2014 TaxID=3418488 RepID=UPI003DA796F6
MSYVLPHQIVALLPLETLPHWPEVVEPSWLEMIGLIIGLPLLIAIVLVLLVHSGALARLARGGAGKHGAYWINPGDPLPAAVDSSEEQQPYTIGERESLIRAVRQAEQESGLEFSLFLGPVPEGTDSADYALELLHSLPDPDRSVLIMSDPENDILEFAGGEEAVRHLGEDDMVQAGVAAYAADEQGDPVTGLIDAVGLLGRHARQPELLHASAESAAALDH